MMEVKYLPVKKDNIKQIPDRFLTDVAGTELVFEISWNHQGFFAMSVYDSNGEVIFEGKKITYGTNMFDNIIDDRLPKGIGIIALDKTMAAEKEGVTYENFYDSVKLYIAGDY